MSNRISPEDPRLTAYALGQLEGAELAAFEAALQSDPAAQAEVAEIRALAGQVESALAAEPFEQPGAVKPRRKARILRFPQVYYLVGGLAAACFAVFVAMRPAYHK